MAVITVSIQIPEELWSLINQSADYHQRTADDVVYTAVDKFFESSAEDVLAIEEGIRQADAGELIDNEEVMADLAARSRRAA